MVSELTADRSWVLWSEPLRFAVIEVRI